MAVQPRSDRYFFFARVAQKEEHLPQLVLRLEARAAPHPRSRHLLMARDGLEETAEAQETAAEPAQWEAQILSEARVEMAVFQRRHREELPELQTQALAAEAAAASPARQERDRAAALELTLKSSFLLLEQLITTASELAALDQQVPAV
jgi:hypothetical protein